jgi:hypothetical protein
MATKKMLVLPVALAVLAVTALTQLASASHVRPKGATPLRVSLVPAYKACTTPDRTHGAPLAFPSCSQRAQMSNSLTVGTPDANGAGANSQGFILLKVDAVPPEDVIIQSTITDVRCLPAVSAAVCNNPNAADGPDYSGRVDGVIRTGQVQGNAVIRISDHYNGPNQDEAGTMVDIPFPVNGQCANTAATNVGGTCTTNTTANAVVPGSVQDAKRGVVEIGQVYVADGGADGRLDTSDNTLFMVQGIFIP